MYDLSRFVERQKNLNLILGSQKKILDKADLGYVKKKINTKTIFKAESLSNSKSVLCGKKAYYISVINDKIKRVIIKSMWDPKGTKVQTFDLPRTQVRLGIPKIVQLQLCLRTRRRQGYWFLDQVVLVI